jgi:hypothetical protein
MPPKTVAIILIASITDLIAWFLRAKKSLTSKVPSTC